MQDYYRAEFNLCMSCFVNPASVVHHHVPQSRSRTLRFDERNYVFLCQGCHMQHHNGDPRIGHNYRQGMMAKYGQGWEDELLTISGKIDKRSDKEWRQFLEGLDFTIT